MPNPSASGGFRSPQDFFLAPSASGGFGQNIRDHLVLLGQFRLQRRVFAAIDLHRSGTRKEELLLDEYALNRVWLLRKIMNDMNVVEAMEFLLERMRKTETNKEFLDSMNQ